MRVSLSNVFQFLVGFLVGIALLIGAGAATAYYFFTRLSANPPLPNFSEEPEEIEAPKAEESPAAEDAPTEAAAESQAEETPEEPEEVVEETKEPEKPKTVQEEFGAQAYRARVTWSDGLSLRSNPSTAGARVGGVYYNDELIVIGTSADGRWQQVHIPATGARAWVKAGNVARFD